jgi:hypothetical protein
VAVFLGCLATLGGIGFALSLASHVASLFGLLGPLGGHYMVLVVGIFALMIPTIFISDWLGGDKPRRNWMKVVLAWCPWWARYVAWASSCYGKVCGVGFTQVRARDNWTFDGLLFAANRYALGRVQGLATGAAML